WVSAKITDTIKRGVVFLPMHWGKKLGKDFSRVNNLTPNIYDPVSKEPDLKFSAVQEEKYKKPKQRIVVVGAGAAAYRCINTYREVNQEDEIAVFSKEKYPFYNRVLLPDYVSDHLSWEALLKFAEGEFEQLNVKLYAGRSVEEINRLHKTVVDSKGQIHDYD